MKKLLFILVILSLPFIFANAQWNGTSTETPINRNGWVGIGTSTVRAPLYVKTAHQWSSSNFGLSLLIDGTKHNSIGLLDYQSLNPLAITNNSGNLLFSKMPQPGNNATAPATLMSISGNGNVGINTTIPLAKLHINNGDNSYGAILGQANESAFQLYTKTLTTNPINTEAFRIGLKYNSDESNGFISFYRGGSGSGGYLGFSTNGIERISVASNGNVGIGTTAPQSILHLSSSIVNETSTHRYDANLLVEATSTTRTIGQGAALGFVVPTTTTGTNSWQQGRILVTPDNGNIDDAAGRMYIQTRYYNNGWDWRNNLVLLSNGNVGIGTDAPNARFNITSPYPLGTTKGDYVPITRTEGSMTGNTMMVNDYFVREDAGGDWFTSSYVRGVSVDASFQDPSTLKSWIKQFPYQERIDFGSSGSTTMTIIAGKNGDLGKVGINCTNPDKELTVKGTIHAREIIVDMQGSLVPDYVFEPTYNLMPLAEVESFVKENKHLPEVPSATEVATNGINVGDMQNKLLQKVEELTLYIIEQQKQIEELKKMVVENKLANK